jgi:hypothetical protein
VAKTKSKPKQREDLRLIGLRVDGEHYRLFEELASEDPERLTAAGLIRRAMREYLQREKKLKA